MHNMREQPAGWYRDPERPSVHRYWTGNNWSEWVGEELALADRVRVPQQSHVERRRDERACG